MVYTRLERGEIINFFAFSNDSMRIGEMFGQLASKTRHAYITYGRKRAFGKWNIISIDRRNVKYLSSAFVSLFSSSGE